MKRSKHRRSLRRAVLVLALLAFGWFENYTVRLQTVHISAPRLPAAFSGLRVAQLSDLHGMHFGPQNAWLLRCVQNARPDLIALTGDLADAHTELDTLRPTLQALCRIAPVYFVTGNHEWVLPRARRQTLFKLLDSCGVTRLENRYVPLRRGDATLWLAGVGDPNGPADQPAPSALFAELRAEAGPDACILLLAHRNDLLDTWVQLGADVVLCGHAHGGVVRLPGLGGLFGPQKTWLPEFDAGLFSRGGTQMYVSPGLGTLRGLPLRLFDRPTVSLLVLTPEKAPET